MESLKLALFQICSTDSFEQNAQKILKLVKDHASSADLLLFPENALYINIAKEEKTPCISLEDDFFEKLQEIAKIYETNIHLGSLPLYEGQRLYNTSIFINEKGEVQKAYNKIHLFKAALGPLDIDESRSYSAGDKPAIVDVKGWKVAMSICFDLRFSELYSFYAKKGAELILVPSAFFRKTGRAHWEILLRARAIESQAYVAASAQVGVHHSIDGESTRASYGHSLAIDPWGEILSDLGESDEGLSIVEIFKNEIQKTRKTVVMTRKL